VGTRLWRRETAGNREVRFETIARGRLRVMEKQRETWGIRFRFLDRKMEGQRWTLTPAPSPSCNSTKETKTTGASVAPDG
jgi:hypothetical protein